MFAKRVQDILLVRRLNLQVKELFASPGGLKLYTEVDNSGSQQKGPAAKTFFTTRFIAAVLLFCIVDITMKLEFHPSPFDIPERSFIWWAVKDYRELKQAPDILLFGSSLMLAGIDTGDATHYNKMVDSAIHHYSSYLSELLSNRYKYPISNFSFAIGGQMASDVYALAANFISERYKPRLIVWGIAPRDLIDAALPSAVSTDTASYMNKISGRELVIEEHKTVNSFIDEFLHKFLYMYRVRDNFLSLLKQSIRKLQVQQADWIVSLEKRKGNNVVSPPGRQKMLRELMNPRDGTMGDIEIGEWLIGGNAEPSKTLVDNTHEYLVRYNPFKPRTFAAQRNYLEKFLQQQKDLGVKVLLVNMPLTGVNMSLLPAPTYDTYLYTIRTLAKKYDADILDLNGDPRFNQSDFFDTVHLNGVGGQKFIEVLSMDKRLAVSSKETLSSGRHSL